MTSLKSDPFGKLLRETKAIDWLATQQLCTINANQPIKECLQLLKERKITGAPVIFGKQAVGIVDVLDVAAYALHLWETYAHEGRLMDFLENNQFFDTPVQKIMNFSGRNKWSTIHTTANLLDCANLFREHQFLLHRLPIVDEKGVVQKIITLFDLVAFANKNLDSVAMGNEKIEKVKSSFRPCISVRHDEYTIDALFALIQNRISGIAIVDYENNLLANFSASDLKGMLSDAFDMFDKPIIDFLRQATDVKSTIPPVSLKWTKQLADVIKTAIDQKVHRIFLLDGDNHFRGVTTCTDVVRTITPKKVIALPAP